MNEYTTTFNHIFHIGLPIWVLALLIAWTLPWKAVALWRSARNGHTVWFIALLLLNTFAILEIVYIFIFADKKKGAV